MKLRVGHRRTRFSRLFVVLCSSFTLPCSLQRVHSNEHILLLLMKDGFWLEYFNNASPHLFRPLRCRRIFSFYWLRGSGDEMWATSKVVLSWCFVFYSQRQRCSLWHSEFTLFHSEHKLALPSHAIMSNNVIRRTIAHKCYWCFDPTS